ncbi:MAG TPA: iron-containing alcohol dehydrogenase [Ktedonobacteraceae bacterium]|nr:iron-containing alcohol dehydrogenase [Ktedonobacteraceae bacterium]
MNEFRYTSYAQEIIFGAGSVAHLGEAVERFNMQRLMLYTSGSLRRDGQIALIEQALGDRLVAVYEGVQPHVPDFQVAEALELANKNEVDALIGMGGGSPIGMAKAVSMALEEKRTGRQAQEGSPIDQPLIPVIAIPTTYAGSEMTPTFGVTYHTHGTTRKVTVTGATITPKLVIYDPLLTLNLPAELTASTGINALAHCVEALYSMTHNPLSTSVALSGIRSIYIALPRCYEEGKDLPARTQMLEGAYFAGFALAHVSMALHHGLCHTLGGTAGVSHGYANSIILPHALGFNLDTVAPQLALMAEAMGIDRNTNSKPRSDEEMAREAVDRIYMLISEMNLPQHLSSVGVKESDIPYLAQVALQSRAVLSNPKPITNVTQIEEILYAAL